MPKPDDQMLIIFGASGDLTKRKLLPSLFELFIRDSLPQRFVILGAARTDFSDETYRAEQKKNLLSFRQGKETDEKQLDEFLKLLYYLKFNSDDVKEYCMLREKISTLRQELDVPDNLIFYLATPPAQYGFTAEALKKNKLNKAEEPGGWRRIVVEKPFGRNLQSAQKLNKLLQSIFHEREIYRIDHFLGKETVQNILVLRFANEIFESLWNRNFIAAVEIRAAEVLGVENRGSYYETAGALRDMIQNHLMQLMGFIAMESPSSFDAELMRDEVAKVFRALRPLTVDDVVRGQYISGKADGKEVVGYREEKSVSPDSNTETYIAMRFFIDNWRWGGVPFYFYTGKRLNEQRSEIIIHFRNVPHRLFNGICPDASCNKLVLRVDSKESISLKFGLKVPGSFFEVKQVSMDFGYDSLCSTYIANAYERLLLDVMQGDSTLYTRTDALEMSWRFVDPILQAWEANPARNLYFYPAGTEGPEERKKLLILPVNASTDSGGSCV